MTIPPRTAGTAKSAHSGSGRLARTTGAGALMSAMVLGGLGIGLALSGPAGAAPSDTIHVKMAGVAAFTDTAPTPLIDFSRLSPGGTVSGSMELMDRSGHAAGSGVTDSLSMAVTNVAIGEACPNACDGAGQNLADSLVFDIVITDGGISEHSSPTFAEFRNASGVRLASGLNDSDIVAVSMTASLPQSAGNVVQYGTLAFDFQITMTSVADAVESVSNPRDAEQLGGDEGNEIGEGPGGDEPIEVGAESTTEPDNTTAGSDDTTGTLVLGTDGNLASTGVRTWTMLGAAVALLVAGLALLLPARRPRS